MKEKRTIYRVGDMVRIVIPDFFVRCGYSLTKSDVWTEINEDELIPILKKYGINKEDNSFYKTLDSIAFGILQSKGFGGNERKIFTETHMSLRNYIGRVRDKFVVKTGFHSSYNDMDIDNGSFIKTGNYLSKQKTNIILELDIEGLGITHPCTTSLTHYPPAIESDCVQKADEIPIEEILATHNNILQLPYTQPNQAS